MSCGKFFTVCSIGVMSLIGILFVVALAMIDLPSLIVSAIVKNRLMDLKGTALPESNNLHTFAITLIVLSSLTIFFGCCCGGQNDWQNSNSSEALRKPTVRNSVMGLLMLAQFVIGISVLATEKELTSNVRVTTVEIFENFNDTCFYVLQGKFQCCGLSGPNYWQGKLESLPSSCCNPIIQMPCNIEVAYEEGCLEKTINYFVEQNRLLGWVTIAFQISKFALVLLLMIGIPFCACCVATNLKQGTVVEYHTSNLV